MTSIRTRITSAVVGCTALVVAVAALLVGTTARAILEKALDDRLRSRSRVFNNVWRQPPNSASDARDSQNPREPREPRDGRDGRDGREPRDWRDWQPTPEQLQAMSAWVSQAVDAETGEEITRSPSLPKEASLAVFGVKPGDPIRTVQLPDGRPFRLLAIESTVRTWGWPWARDGARETGREPGATEPPTAPERRAAITWIAVDASDLSSEVEHLAWILVAVWAGATALAWAGALVLSRTVLRPVASLSRTIESLSPQNLAARVPMEEVPGELSIVVARLNALLDRLEAAFRRERATIANMAHELRNPISALRTTLEFGLYHDLPPQGRKTVESSLALAMRMQSLVNGLLTLTRIEAGQEVLSRKEVDLVRVLHEAWTTVDSRAKERGLVPAWSGPDSLPLVTSPAHLELVAANLLDNAVSHGAAPGEIEVELERDDASARLRVTNGCAETAVRAGLFEPFWRSDPARSDTRHFGLGLALCDRVVRLLGGTIEARQEAQRFTVTVTLPAARVPSETVAAAS